MAEADTTSGSEPWVPEEFEGEVIYSDDEIITAAIAALDQYAQVLGGYRFALTMIANDDSLPPDHRVRVFAQRTVDISTADEAAIAAEHPEFPPRS